MFRFMRLSDRIESTILQRIYQCALTGWLRLSKGRLPPGIREIAFCRKAALGDVLMSTAVIREFKLRNPKAKVSLFTDYAQLLHGVSWIDAAGPFESRPRLHFNLRYEEAERSPRHWVRIMGEMLGLKPDPKPVCGGFESETRRWKEKLSRLPRPVIGIQRKAGGWTPNKDWPEHHWDALVQKLQTSASVIEIGGGTELGDLVGAIRNCDLIVGPISGPAHVAAAFSIPSVILYSGYELPEFTLYPTTTALRFEVECAPCWLRTPCPYEMKCMTGLTVDSVFETISNKIRSANSSSQPG